jgi:hypothetical protein
MQIFHAHQMLCLLEYEVGLGCTCKKGRSLLACSASKKSLGTKSTWVFLAASAYSSSLCCSSRRRMPCRSKGVPRGPRRSPSWWSARPQSRPSWWSGPRRPLPPSRTAAGAPWPAGMHPARPPPPRCPARSRPYPLARRPWLNAAAHAGLTRPCQSRRPPRLTQQRRATYLPTGWTRSKQEQIFNKMSKNAGGLCVP